MAQKPDSSTVFTVKLNKSPNRRYYINPFPATFDPEVVKSTITSEEFRTKIRKYITTSLDRISYRYDPFRDRNLDIYVGAGGLAFLYFHLSNTYAEDNKPQQQKYLEQSVAIIEHCMKNIKRSKVAFLHGHAGIYSIAIVLYHKLGSAKQSKTCRDELIKIYHDLIQTGNHPSELLFGHSGYLYSLLFVNCHIPGYIDNTLIYNVLDFILKRGVVSKEASIPSPIMYTWHDKHYIGAAHGLAGIVYMLLNLQLDTHPEQIDLVQGTIKYLLSLQTESGNFPSSLESAPQDHLVQYCHGAPGIIPMLCLATKSIDKSVIDKPLREAIKTTWNYGLLTKGHGLCHGVAGNGYAFLSAYNALGDVEYLYYALKFTEFILNFENTEGSPDNLYSLYEGLAGTICFMADMLNVSKAAFPGFELPKS